MDLRKILAAGSLLLAGSCTGKIQLPAGAAVPGAGNDPGIVTIHRLNRAEYNNTVRDLLGDTTQPANAFPADYGATFDNNASTLTIAPLLFDKYQTAAEALVEAATQTSNPIYGQLISCDPMTLGHDACAQQILGAFAKRAWRRPITLAELSQIVGFVTMVEQAGDTFLSGIKVAMRFVLTSPYFIFRVELDPDPNATTPRPLNGYELASRLSYFLWSSMPDDALFAAADGDQLTDANALAAQVARMLADPKADALAQDFAGQWLSARRLQDVTPDRTVFPSWDEPLRAAMASEVQLVFNEFVHQDLPALDLIDTNFTFANQRLATHYGLAGVSGAGFVKVPLAGTQRAGLLTLGGILTVTAAANRTSIVRRGKWVLTQLLCEEPPPPPPGVPPLPEPSQPTGTLRQRLDAHVRDPVCASCHNQIDPVGFALEHFDGIGAWRDQDNGMPVDATGQLPDGSAFDGAAQLTRLIRNHPAVPGCLATKLFTYALGREPTAADGPVLKDLGTKLNSEQLPFKKLIQLVVASDAFRARRPSAGGSP